MFSHHPDHQKKKRQLSRGRKESYKNHKEMIAKSQPSLNPGQSAGLSRAGIPPPLSHVGALEGGMFVLSGCAGYGLRGSHPTPHPFRQGCCLPF